MRLTHGARTRRRSAAAAWVSAARRSRHGYRNRLSRGWARHNGCPTDHNGPPLPPPRSGEDHALPDRRATPADADRGTDATRGNAPLRSCSTSFEATCATDVSNTASFASNAPAAAMSTWWPSRASAAASVGGAQPVLWRSAHDRNLCAPRRPCVTRRPGSPVGAELPLAWAENPCSINYPAWPLG